jgi:hypothetical protein
MIYRRIPESALGRLTRSPSSELLPEILPGDLFRELERVPPRAICNTLLAEKSGICSVFVSVSSVNLCDLSNRG